MPPTCGKCGARIESSPSDPTVVAKSRGGTPGGGRPAETTEADALIGQELGGCRIERKLGQGGMGAVYKAHHLALDIPVAVKILPPEFARAHPGAVERFSLEARAAAKLQHPNIVGVLNVGMDRGFHFIVMQFVDGDSLQRIVEREGPLPVPRALAIARQVVEALRVAGEHRIVHRDIKPDNVLIGSDGIARLADLGLAKNIDSNHELTASGTALGTPHYMAPEQAEDAKRADHRSDLYSVGCILYRMLCGRVPYDGSSLFAILKQHVEAPVPDARRANPAIPARLAAIIARLMAKAPADRFQTAGELHAALASAGEETRLPPAPVAAPAGARPRMPAVMLALFAAFVLLPVAYAVLHGKSTPPKPDSPPAGTGGIAETPPDSGKKPAVPDKDLPIEEQVKQILKELTRLNGTRIEVRSFGGSGVKLAGLDLSDQPGLTRLDPLKGLRLNSLKLARTGVSDLSVLEGMPLLTLNIQATQVSELSPLKNASLTELNCVDCRITDLSPISGQPLQRLECSGNPISSLEPLRGMPIEILHCADCKIPDLDPLKGMPLRELHVAGNRIQDLTPLRDMPLVQLGCEGNPITDLLPLDGMPLVTLIFTPENVTQGMSVLKAMRSLKYIDTKPSDDGVFQSAKEFWKTYDAEHR